MLAKINPLKVGQGQKTAIVTRCFDEKYCRQRSLYFKFPDITN